MPSVRRVSDYTVSTLAAAVERVCVYDPDRLSDALSLFGQACWALGAVDLCERLNDKIPIASMRAVFDTARRGFSGLADEYGARLFDVLGREVLI